MKKEHFYPLVAERIPELIQHYRWFHQHPELSGEERETAQYIIAQLEKHGIAYRHSANGHGIIAEIHGTLSDKKKRTIALRADMDALPIEESEEHTCRSLNTGVMHACGHDFHITSLLGALMIIQQQRNTFSGTVKGIFQPSEERYEGGAKFMIEEGALENPKVDVIYGLHADPALETGTVGFKTAQYMASTDEIHLTIIGKGGHAAMPKDSINPIFIGADILSHLKKLAETAAQKEKNPVVLNFGKFVAGNSNNVVPEIAELSGTIRLFNEELRTKMKQEITKIVHETAHRYGGRCDLNIKDGYPVLENDPEATQNAQKIAIKLLGTENVKTLALRTTAEDFSYFLQKIPGCFFRVGTGNKDKNISANLHSPHFQIDERALEVSTAMLVALVLN